MANTTIDILPLPNAVIPVESKMDLRFTDADIDQNVLDQQRMELMAQQAEQNRELCNKQPWWSCNTTDTQGACHFGDNSTCVPVGLEQEPKSYFDKWIQVFGPFYRSMQQQTPRQRSLSIEPRPKVNLTQPSQQQNLSQPELANFIPGTKSSKIAPLFLRGKKT